MYDIVIQIVNYNTKPYLIRCLESIFNDLKNSNLNYKINILDNASNDDLSDLEYLSQTYPISFYKSEKNGGFGYGHNILSQKDSGKYIFILNPDIKFIQPNSIQNLYQYINSNSLQIKAIGPKVIYEKDLFISWDHGDKLTIFNDFLTKIGISICFKTNKIKQVNRVCGCSMMIEKEIFDKIKGFDENFFLYKEEEDLCLRIRQKGFQIIYNPNIKIFHHGGVVAQRSNHIRKSQKYFIKKWLFKKSFDY